jgi:hypothetical protein
LIFNYNLCWATPIGPDGSYNIIYDFNRDWLTYSHDLQAYIPYSKTDNNEIKNFSLKLNLDDYPNAFIIIKNNTDNCFLFFNETLEKQLTKDKWYVFETKIIKSTTKNSELVLTFFGKNMPEDISVYAGFPNNLTKQTKNLKVNSKFNLVPRDFGPISSSMAIIFVLNIVMFSFLSSNYTKAYKKYYNVNDLTSVNISENSFMVSRPLDRPNMFFVILLSIMGGFLVILIQKLGFQIFNDSFLYKSGNTFGIVISNYFKISLLIFIAFIFKYFYLLTFGKLFNIEKMVDFHYFKIVQSSIFFFTFCILFALIVQNIHLNISSNIEPLIEGAFTVFYILRTALVYFTINRKGNIKTLYLISYLCIVELFPIILGIQIFF